MAINVIQHIKLILCIFAMRLNAFVGINRQSIITGGSTTKELTRLKNTRYAHKRCRVSFFNLIILSPYRWLVKRLAQLQVTLVGSDNCPYWTRERFPSGAFSFSFLLEVFFSLSFKIAIPLRGCADVIRCNTK